jgi:hypothetical protein
MMLTWIYTAVQSQQPVILTTKLQKTLEDLFPFSMSPVKWKDYSVNADNGNHVKIYTSLFSKTEVIDNRFDTSVIGFVRENNRNAFLFASSRLLQEQVAATADKLISSARKQDGTILINIRKYYLSEYPGGNSYNLEAGRGKFMFKADCYLKNDTLYKLMFTVDTMVRVKSQRDATDKLMDTVRGIWGAFILQAALFDTTACGKKQFTVSELQHIDELEKKEIPVYTAALPKNGIYASWEEFKNNQPIQEKFITEYRKGFKRPLVYEMTEDNKKGKEILRRDYYIICDGGNMFISAIYGLFPLTKKDNDFYFTIGKGDNAQASLENTAFKMYEALGGMAANANAVKDFEFKIDHTTGRFLPIFKQPL